MSNERFVRISVKMATSRSEISRINSCNFSSLSLSLSYYFDVYLMAFLEYDAICLNHSCVYLHVALTANDECWIGRENDRNEANGYWPQLIFSPSLESYKRGQKRRCNLKAPLFWHDVEPGVIELILNIEFEIEECANNFLLL